MKLQFEPKRHKWIPVSYTHLDVYKRQAKDHRTKVEVGDVDKVLDGYLEPFLRGYLLAKRRGTAVAAEPEDDLDV